MRGKYFKADLIKRPRFWLGLIGCLGADQVSKLWAGGAGLVIINRGVSWGWGEQFSGLMLLCLLIGLVCFLYWFLYSLWLKYPLESGIFFGAGLSNILDRILTGGVKDWWTVPGLEVKNNFADLAIVGIVSIIIVRIAYEQYTNLLSRPGSSGH